MSELDKLYLIDLDEMKVVEVTSYTYGEPLSDQSSTTVLVDDSGYSRICILGEDIFTTKKDAYNHILPLIESKIENMDGMWKSYTTIIESNMNQIQKLERDNITRNNKQVKLALDLQLLRRRAEKYRGKL